MFRLFLQKRVFVLSRHEQKYNFYKFRCNNLHFRLESKKLICSRFCAKLQLLQYITTRKEEKRRSKSYSLQIERYEFHLFPFQSHFLLIRNFVCDWINLSISFTLGDSSFLKEGNVFKPIDLWFLHFYSNKNHAFYFTVHVNFYKVKSIFPRNTTKWLYRNLILSIFEFQNLLHMWLAVQTCL